MIHACKLTSSRHTINEAQKGHHDNIGQTLCWSAPFSPAVQGCVPGGPESCLVEAQDSHRLGGRVWELMTSWSCRSCVGHKVELAVARAELKLQLGA